MSDVESAALRPAGQSPADEARIRPLGRPGDLGWVVMAHGELYAREFGWDNTFETLVAEIVANFARHRDGTLEEGWIAEVGGERAGCVLCVRDQEDPAVAHLRILLVDERFRGHALGRRLVDTCVTFAKSCGYQRIRLWTVDVLGAARRVYRAAGFELLDQTPQRGFGKDLVGQHWSREL